MYPAEVFGMYRILVVEDEKSINDLIVMNLTEAGYTCERAFDGMEAADKLEGEPFDLVLLDIMLPEVNGYELLDFIKPMGIPVIFITAKGSMEDKVRGLRLGADDYLVKPFEIVELLARVEAVLRRAGKAQYELEIDGLTIDTRSHTVSRGSKPIQLTAKEFELLLLFIQNRNIALFRETIYERIWGGEYMGDSRTVDLHVQRLRKKLDLGGQLLTVFGVGYKYAPRA